MVSNDRKKGNNILLNNNLFNKLLLLQRRLRLYNFYLKGLCEFYTNLYSILPAGNPGNFYIPADSTIRMGRQERISQGRKKCLLAGNLLIPEYYPFLIYNQFKIFC